MNQITNPSTNPYASPQATGTPQRSDSRWKRMFLAAFFVLLPCLATWSFMELGPVFTSALSIEEPEDPLKTPNPTKAPWPIVSNTQVIMTFTSPRLSAFAGQWTYFVYACVPIWSVVAPAIFRKLQTGGLLGRWLSRLGLVPASLITGAVLAWPWLAVIFFGGWLPP